MNRQKMLLYTLFLLLGLLLSACGVVGRAIETTPGTIRPTDAGPRPGPGPQLVWEGHGAWGDEDATRCKTLQISADRQMALGYCGQSLTTTPLNRPEFDEMLDRFAAFDLRTPTDGLTFQGHGRIDDPAWQRAVLAWAHWTFGESWSGRPCAACRTALSWHFGPVNEEPSQCAHLTVLDYGYAYAEVLPCEGGPVTTQTNGWLETNEWVQLDGWLYNRSALYSGDNYLAAVGSQSMTEAERAQLEGLARSIYIRLSGSTLAEPSGSINCPEANAGTRLLTHARHGYCVLYPGAYKVEKPNANETDLVIGSLLNAQDPRVNIFVEEANGRTAEEMADQVIADLTGFDVERGSVTVGGVEAIVLDKLPGQEINRRVWFVHNGRLYQMMFMPSDESLGEAYAGMEALYEQVVGSFTFFPPVDEVALGEDCLESNADEQPLTYEAYNFCVLYPTGYDVDEGVENQVVLYVGSLMDVEHAKAFINVEDAAGRTAEQVADDLATEVESSLPDFPVERTFGLTVGYEPAWVLENVPGQDISRQVVVVHDGRLYTLTFVPASPDAGAAFVEMENLYTTVINSFRFLR